MKKTLSFILSLAMVISLFTVFFVTNAAAVTEISNTSPAITADVGEKITLSGYSVVFDGDTAATSGVTWKNSSGTTITSFTPDAKGVTALTATSGTKSKTVYVVAKEASETEYVLFEADMSAYNTVAELEADGWNAISADSYYDLSGDDLLIDATATQWTTISVALPSWLGDFGDFAFEAEAMLISPLNTGRWMSLFYRNENAKATYPLYQMCIRDNTTASNGVEFSELNSSGWNVLTQASGELSTLTSAYHTFEVEAFGDTISNKIDGAEALFVAPETYATTTISSLKGALGLSACGTKLSLKSVKVTVQETVPEQAPVVLDLINNSHEDNVLINPIANVQSVSGSDASTVLNGANAPGSVMLTVSEISDVNAALKACIDNNILPTFYITSNAEADKVIAAMDAYVCKDINAVSASASVLAYIRGKNYLVRTGLDLTDSLKQTTLTSDEAHDIRVQVRSAPATFCVIDSDYATKQLVAELQELAVSVWANVDGTPGSDEFTLNTLNAITAGVNGVISLSASDVTSAINSHLAENSMTRTPIIIGHRGNPTQAPENSISGFWAAYNNGADVFELDVEVTSDEVVVVMHDDTITRTTTYEGDLAVHDMTLEEVKSYYLLDNNGNATTEKVPTLEEVLLEFKDTDIRIFVEFKWTTVTTNVSATMAMIEKLGLEDRVDVISFMTSYLTKTQTHSPGMSTGYLFVPSLQDGTTMQNALLSLYDGLVTAQQCNSTINPSYKVLVSENNYYSQAVTDRGQMVWPWTFSGSEGNNIGFMTGCNGITTDDAQWAKDMAKYMTAEDFSLAVGAEYAGGAVTVSTYGGEDTLLKARDTIYSIVDGSEYVEVVNGKLVGKAEGTAKVIFGYVTATAHGSQYVIYSQPVDVKVTAGDKDAFTPLLKIAETLTYDEYEEDTLIEIRKFIAEANTLSDSSDATAEEIAQVCIELGKLINDDCIVVEASKGVSYTTTTPDYEYWANPEQFKDDGIRLTDGIKSVSDVDSSAYSAWKAASNPVEVVLDLGEGAETNIYNVYTCGGFWGIENSNGFTVQGSNDGTNFTDIGSTTTVNTIGNGDIIDGASQSVLYSLTVTSDTVQSYRYIKFIITINGNFLWIDEVEAILDIGVPASVEGIYINGFNSIIGAGDTHIFTHDFNNGVITSATANHRYTQNLIAKWDETYGGYIVVSNAPGNGTGEDITLAEDEILIAAHCETTMPESVDNFNKLASIEIGKQIVCYGVDIENTELGIAPYIKSATPVEPEPEFIRGDVNADSEIKATDYLLLKRILLGAKEMETLTNPETAKQRCDVNANGTVNSTDYLLLKRYLLGMYEIPQ